VEETHEPDFRLIPVTTLRPYFLTIIALLAGIAIARRAGDVVYDPEPGLRTELPDRAGVWRGEQFLICQNPACAKSFAVSELNGAQTCPACHGELAVMAPIEKELLPPDTYLRRSVYTSSIGASLSATLVLSGKDRASIHRPEVCLTGPGSEIVDSRDVQVLLAGRPPFAVHVLTLRHTEGGKISYSFFAYWFSTKGHETPSHMQRMWWTAEDRVLHNLARRWAYVSVSGGMTPGTDAHLDELRAFLRDFVPQLAPR
jgi:hypothetical protein